MSSIISSLFLTEKCYCFKILPKLLREQYFLHFVFLFLSVEESYNNIVLQSCFHTHTHINTTLSSFCKKWTHILRFSSRPTPPLLAILLLVLILIPCRGSQTWLWTIITLGAPSKRFFFLGPTWNSQSLGLELHFEVLQVMLTCPSTHQLGTINE